MNPLTVFPRHPSAPDTYYINGAWAPAAITAVEKRFSQGELAAEYHHQRERFYTVHEGYSVTSEGIKVLSPDTEWQRMNTLRRFCTLPHHDEDPA